MKVLEIKNNLVKISYTAKDNLVISGFVIIEDLQYAYVAQVMSLKADSGLNYAIVKLLFTFNEEGVVKNYNGSVPELDSSITPLSSDELLDILPIETPLTIGKLAQQDFILNVDFSALERKLVVCSDNTENTDILISNMAKQITANNCKSVIFDTQASIKAENRLTFGIDFKLPLNYNTINFIYEHDLSDIDASSKAVIQDILIEVQEYANTLIDKFIPFDLFVNVIESQYKQTGMPELALLKSRLIKYRDENVFAQTAKEFQTFRAELRGNLSTLIDISRVDSALQKLVISYAYDEIEASDLFVYSLVKINNDNSDKKLMKKLITQDKIFTSIICPHNYRYIHELKEVAGNMILFTPQTVQHDFAAYNVFLNKLNPDEMVIYGKATQNIPLILELLPYEDLERLEEEYSESQDKTNDEMNSESDSFNEESDTYSQESMINDTPDSQESETSYETEYEQDEPQQEVEETEKESSEEYSEEETQPEEEQESYIEEQETEPEINENSDYIQEEQPEETDIEEPEIQEEQPAEQEVYEEEEFEEEEQQQEEEFSEEYENPTIEENLSNEYSEEIIEEPQEYVEEQDNTEEFNNPEQEEYNEEAYQEEDFNEEGYTEEEQYVESNPEIAPEQEFEAQEEQAVQEDELTEQDLDYIETNPNINEEENFEAAQEQNFSDDMDEFNNVEEETANQDSFDTQNVEEPEFMDSEYIEENLNLEDSEDSGEQPGVVPIYPAEEDTPITADIPIFEPGDRVSHPKYGEGVVEKMVKFGNKVLCSINFANGRRLLDPAISQIERI